MLKFGKLFGEAHTKAMKTEFSRTTQNGLLIDVLLILLIINKTIIEKNVLIIIILCYREVILISSCA